MDMPLYRSLEEALDEVGAPPTEGRKTWHQLVDATEKVERLARRAKLAPEVWSQPTPYRWPSAERFLGWAQGCGQFKGRFDGLDEHARRAALDMAAGTLARLAPDDFVWSPEIVYCIARR